ncbi:MAG: cytochrome c biogenesis protein CcdA [Chloroflexi bacterium]|nr:cytochrome c biogenesis protein CcdA [Chloroflexota bacterium]
METFVASFLLGIGTAASPCLLPLYPGFLAYLSGKGEEAGRGTALLGFAVVAGVLTTVIAVGIVISALALPLGGILEYLVPITTVVLIGLGLLLLSGRNPFERLASVQVPVVKHPGAQAYVYGIMLGPVAIPCSGPFLIALLAISVGAADAAARLGTFVLFGLGFGLPLILLSLVGAARGRVFTRWVASHHTALLRVAGVLLILTAMAEPLRIILSEQG